MHFRVFHNRICIVANGQDIRMFYPYDIFQVLFEIRENSSCLLYCCTFHRRPLALSHFSEYQIKSHDIRLNDRQPADIRNHKRHVSQVNSILS